MHQKARSPLHCCTAQNLMRRISIKEDGPEGCKYVSDKTSPAGALRASLAVVSAVAAAVLAVA